MTLLQHKYDYKRLIKEDGGANGRCYVTPDSERLASVTTILDRTKPLENKIALANWRKRIGTDKAQTITTEAASRGTSMHKQLENYMRGSNAPPGGNMVHQHAYKMAQVIIKEYLMPNVPEVWGLETQLYYPGLYAGTTDAVGLWNGVPSILDFKQTNKPKKEEWVTDYKLQLCAYAHAHNKMYETNIRQGVIIMCSQDLAPQHWVIGEKDFDYWSDKWWARVKEFYS